MINTILESFDIWTRSQTIKSNGRTAGVDNQRLLGIDKLRELILELAVRGKLVSQDEKEKHNDFCKIKENVTEPPYEINKNWQWRTLGRTLELITDGSHFSPPTCDSGYPYITVKDVDWKGNIDLVNCKKIDSKSYLDLVNSGCKPNKNDVLFSKDGTVGKTAVVDFDFDFVVLSSLAILRPSANLSPYFLKMLLISPSILNQALEKKTGSALKRIVLANIKKIKFPLPPLAEQHRIVAKVDELMSLCDQLEQQQTENNTTHHQLVELLLQNLIEATGPAEFATAWQRIAANFDILFTTEYSIDQLKQTILQLAVMGKLVPQDPKDEPASELLRRIAKEKERLVKEGKIKKQEKLPLIKDEDYLLEYPESWTLERLGKIANVGTGATPIKDKSVYYFPKEINWVTSGETSNDFIYQTAEKISSLALKETNVSVYPPGTLIIAMYGQGKTRGQISELMIEAGTNQACAAVQLLTSDICHRKYIKYFFKKAYDEIREQSAGGAQPNLNVGKITNTIIPIPPLAEQHRIVAKVDELFALCDALKERIKEGQEMEGKLAEGVVDGVLG